MQNETSFRLFTLSPEGSELRTLRALMLKPALAARTILTRLEEEGFIEFASDFAENRMRSTDSAIHFVDVNGAPAFVLRKEG